MDQEPVEHHGRDYLLGGVGFIAECCAMRWGGLPLALFGGVLLFLAFWDYTKKYLSNKSPYLRLGSRIAVGFLLIVLVLVISGVHLSSKKSAVAGPEVAVNNKPLPSPPEVSPLSSSEPTLPKKRKPTSIPKPGTAPIPLAHVPQPSLAPIPTPPFTQNCPQGICNGGDNNGDQRVYNFGSPEPKVSWVQEPQPLKDGKYEVLVTLKVDHSLDVTAFEAICDKPCTTRFDYIVGEVLHGPLLGSPNPKVVALFYTIPRPLGAGVNVYWYIDSLDDQPIQITTVDKIPISQLPVGAQ